MKLVVPAPTAGAESCQDFNNAHNATLANFQGDLTDISALTATLADITSLQH